MDLQGKTILVTGATDGIGMQTALDLAQMGASVIVHGRDSSRGASAVEMIRRETGRDSVTFERTDFASLRQVRALAEAVRAKYPRLDVLINNAGVSTQSRQVTEDGYELTFQVNHLAHFLLTNLLLDFLKSSAPSRIVNVSSQVHRSGQIDFDDLQLKNHFDGYAAYRQSKLCNVMFSNELAARLKGTGVTSNSLHPGVIATKLLHGNFPGITGDDLERGAETSVWLASSPDFAGVTGEYFENHQVYRYSPLADDPALRAWLWQVSEKLCGLA